MYVQWSGVLTLTTRRDLFLLELLQLCCVHQKQLKQKKTFTLELNLKKQLKAPFNLLKINIIIDKQRKDVSQNASFSQFFQCALNNLWCGELTWSFGYFFRIIFHLHWKKWRSLNVVNLM